MAAMESVELRAEAAKEWASYEGPSKPYLAAEQDSRDMQRMGKEQKFRRNFRVVSICSFCLATMMGFVFIPINSVSAIEIAGTGGTIVMFIGNFFGFLTIVLSLAEMSSIAPTAGGQYHWVSEFAPPSQQKFLSYLSGWLSSLSWLVGVASAMFLAGNLIPALISLMHPSVVPQAWQGYLFVVAICSLCFIINGYLAKYLPLLEGFVLCFMVMAFIAIVVTLLVLSPKLSSAEVFQSFPQLDSTGILELIASQVFLFYSLLGSDSTAHMAEETQHANVIIPRAMVASYGIMGLASFVILIAFEYCLVDLEAALATKTGYPFLEVFINATGSAEGAVTLVSIQIILIVLSVTNFMASCSRQVFAFARDDGLPIGKLIARVYNKSGSPLNSLIVVWLFVVLISLVGLGSSVAFNAIISLQVMAISATYEVSMLCMVWRRLFGERLPRAYWSLGRFGLPLNALGALYGLYLLAYSAMPPVYPVTAENFNWAPVMFGGVMFLSMLYYFIWARRIYEGPVVYVMRDY